MPSDMETKWTVKKAKEVLAEIGMTIRNTGHGDYRVNFKGGEEATAAYDSDLKSAVDTAVAMYMRKEATAADIFVVVMAPSKTLPSAVYGPFPSKHAAWVFVEDRLGQEEGISAKDQRAYVVRGYGVPKNPVDVIA